MRPTTRRTLRNAFLLCLVAIATSSLLGCGGPLEPGHDYDYETARMNQTQSR